MLSVEKLFYIYIIITNLLLNHQLQFLLQYFKFSNYKKKNILFRSTFEVVSQVLLYPVVSYILTENFENCKSLLVYTQ